MPRMSGKTRHMIQITSKLVFSLCIGCILVMSLMFMKYKFVYNVKVNSKDAGYVTSKIALENRIDDFVMYGDADNVGYVVLNAKVDYQTMLVNKDISTKENEIFAQIREDSNIFYRTYAVMIGDKQKALVETLEEAEAIVAGVNEKQSIYKEKETLEIEEKYLEEYECTESIEVAVNDIFEPIKKTNEAIREIRTTPASVQTVPDEVLLALKENLATLDFEVPVNGAVITSRFGWRSSGYHYGVDLATPVGTDIVAAESGVVTYAAWCGNYGYLVKIQHTGGYETRYAHCSKLLVNVGDEVVQGNVIAKVGSTGRSTGPHLHLEIRYEDAPLNPEVFIYD